MLHTMTRLFRHAAPAYPTGRELQRLLHASGMTVVDVASLVGLSFLPSDYEAAQSRFVAETVVEDADTAYLRISDPVIGIGLQIEKGDPDAYLLNEHFKYVWLTTVARSDRPTVTH